MIENGKAYIVSLQSLLSKICCIAVTILKNRQILGWNPCLLHCTHIDPQRSNLFYCQPKRTQRRWGDCTVSREETFRKRLAARYRGSEPFSFQDYLLQHHFLWGSGSKANFFQALIEKIFSCNIAVFCAVHFAAFQTGKNGIGKRVHEKRHRVS